MMAHVFAPLLLCILFLSRAALATSGEEDGLSRLLQAHSPGQLRRIAEEQQRMRRSHLVCEAELNGKRLPIACYERLKLEDRRIERIGISRDLAWLDRLCVERTSANRDWKELQSAEASRWISGPCRTAVERRLADLHYIDQAERPAELFARLIKGGRSSAWPEN